jgi:hypothetical protein
MGLDRLVSQSAVLLEPLHRCSTREILIRAGLCQSLGDSHPKKWAVNRTCFKHASNMFDTTQIISAFTHDLPYVGWSTPMLC